MGNWVADEVLYQARIHPEQPVCELSEEMIDDLHSHLKKVIGLAVEVDSDSTRFPKDWLFHFRYVLINKSFLSPSLSTFIAPSDWRPFKN